MTVSCSSNRPAAADWSVLPSMRRDDDNSATPNADLAEVNNLHPIVMPSILLSNVNRIMNKLDDLYAVSILYSIDLICITESWLTPDVPDSACFIPGYQVFRKDRKSGLGGGVMCYARESMRCCVAEPNSGSVRDGFEHEILWLIIRPPTLPRPIGVIVLVIVYCPPWYGAEMKRSLVRTITFGVDFFAGKFSNPCFLILGDFNSLDINFFLDCFISNS